MRKSQVQKRQAWMRRFEKLARATRDMPGRPDWDTAVAYYNQGHTPEHAVHMMGEDVFKPVFGQSTIRRDK